MNADTADQSQRLIGEYRRISGQLPSLSSLYPRIPSGRERNGHPTSLAIGQLNGVDQLLHVGAILEIAFILRPVAQDLADERAHEVRVKQRPPRFPLASARRIEPLGHLELTKL